VASNRISDPKPHSLPAFECRVLHSDGTGAAEVRGELDMQTAPQLQRVLEGLVRSGHGDISVNCSGLTFIDSSGLAVFTLIDKLLGSRSSHIRLVGVNSACRRTFVITKLDYLLDDA
jgi:anti-sigma B factor antagonist